MKIELAVKWKMAAVSVASLFVMAGIDYATGYELIFSAAYLVPMALCAWYLGRRAVWLMALASGAATWLVDALSHHPYSHYLIQYWNSFTCFLVSLVTGLLIIRLRGVLEQQRQVNQELETTLRKLEESTDRIRQLQNGLQVVCAWTNQIKVGDQWMTPDEFLSSQLHLKISHGMSPEATRQFEQEIRSVGETETPRPKSEA